MQDDDPEPLLQVYAVGTTTVVGFGGSDVLEDVNLALCRDELIALIKTHAVEVLAFDVTGVKLMPSGLLGLLASMKQQGVDVHVYNPSPDVRDVLGVTHLDRLIEIHEVEVEGMAVGNNGTH